MFGTQENCDFRSIGSSARVVSSLSSGTSDSGVFNNVCRSSTSPSEQNLPISESHSRSHQINNLLHQTVNLIAVNAELRKEIQLVRATQLIGGATAPVIDRADLRQATLPFSSLGNGTRGSRGNGYRRCIQPDSYKTVMCQAWLESKICAFAENCKFAHGEAELRPAKIQPKQMDKYKTKLCDKYTTTGLCPYGARCLFVHPFTGANAYIRPDKISEVSQRHALVDLANARSAVTGKSDICSGTDIGRPVTPVESQLIPLCPTPIRDNQPNQGKEHCKANRPHPSWPLEPTAFFMGKSSNTTVMAGIPTSISQTPNGTIGTIASSIGLAHEIEANGRESLGRSSIGYISGHSTPESVLSQGISPFYTLSSSSAAFNITDDEPDFECFNITGLDKLAEEFKRNLQLW